MSEPTPEDQFLAASIFTNWRRVRDPQKGLAAALCAYRNAAEGNERTRILDAVEAELSKRLPPLAYQDVIARLRGESEAHKESL